MFHVYVIQIYQFYEEGSKLKKSIVFLLFSLCLIFISIASYVWAGDVHLAPDGTFVGGEPQLAPDGTYVGVESDW